MAQNNFSDIVLIEAAYLLSPLKYLDTPEKAAGFLKKLGYTVPATNLLGAIGGTLSKINTVVIKSADLIKADDSQRMAAIIALLPAIKGAIDEIIKLDAAVRNASGLPAGVPLDQLPKRLLDYLIFLQLYLRYPKLFGVLLLMGVLEEQNLPKNDAINQPACSLKVVNWDVLIRYFTEPGAVIDDVYDWKTNFNSDLFLTRFQLVLRALAIPGGLYKQSPNVKNALGNTTADLTELRVPVFSKGIYPTAFTQFGVNLTPVEAKTSSSRKKGLAVIPYLLGTTSFSFDLNEDWETQLKSNLTLDAGLGLMLTPEANLEIFEQIFTAPLSSGSLDSAMIIRQKAGADNKVKEIYLFNKEGGGHMFLKDVAFTFFGKTSSNSKDAGVEIDIKTIELLLKAAEGDAFLQKILPAEGIKASMGLGVGLSYLNGFYFKGSSGIEILIPVHIQLGPIEIVSILIVIKPENGKILIELGSTIKAELGPIKAVVENIGLKSNLTFPADKKGNLGPIDVSLDFKPPNGVGLSIEAGIVSGGGYLFIDNEKGEYAGILQLTIQGLVSLTAIGLITTKLPDGTPSFSMLIIITAEFMPPFQLSYGFTLIGVGGLLGINRIVLLDPLRDGVRTGGINSIMFPTDVIANAPRIISDLKAIFPPTEGYFLIGPMAKIGWGTPTLISLALGIIIQLPDPKIAILGVLKIVLPTEDAEVLKLQVNFLGTIDPSNQLITFDASLFESHILHTMTLTGDMAVRLKWGEKPDFIMSAGGFHPEYNPTMPVPSLSRIGITVLDLENARIRVQTYFALTSNTVQFGARADCYFGFDGFSVTGYLGFDALMQFSPFTFKATCSGGFVLETSLGDASVDISALIMGPGPWYVNATGSIKVFGIEFEADFEKEWGQSKSDILPDISIKPLFLEEMQKAEVWHAELPEGKLQMVSLTSPKIDEGAPIPPLRIHPFGSVVISQKMLPFNFQMDKFGNQKITDVKKISIESVKAGTTSSRLSLVKDNFAVSQFKNMSDGEKISNPSFEKFECGVKANFGSNNTDFNMGGSVRRSLEYDEIFVDKVPKKSLVRFLHNKADFKNLLKHSSVSKSKLSVQYKNNLGMVNKKINVSEDNLKYTIANTTDNKPIQADMGFDTIADALNSLSGILAKNPALKGNLILMEKD